MAKQTRYTSTLVKPKKSGKPGKLLTNQFGGYNDPPKGKSRVNNFSPMQATDMIVSGDGGMGGGIVVQAVPNFDDPQNVFIDPLVTDPIGLRTTINSGGDTVYVNANSSIKSTVSPTVNVDTSGPEVTDTSEQVETLNPQGAASTTDTSGTKKSNTILIIIAIAIVLIGGYVYFKNKS